MLPLFACNLLTATSLPPWKEGLDWGLYTTLEWEKRVPFHAYVCNSPTLTPADRRIYSFPQFSKLPSELQLRILALCPAHTLFQWMHVSSNLRIEASKLFWATPNASFLVEARWLLDGAYPGDTNCDLSFLFHVRQIEIAYHSGTHEVICPLDDDERVLVRQDFITRFWESVARILPNTQRVVISQNWETPLWWKDTEPIAQPLRLLMQAHPPEIEVAVLTLERTNPTDTNIQVPPTKKWRRSLYQPVVGGGWERSDEKWRRTTILVPPKPFNGPVGEFQRCAYKGENARYQKAGLWPLMIEALDRNHFDKGRNVPFTCPFSGCDTYFIRAGEWTVHAIDLHCQAWRAGDPMPFLPDELRAAFEEKVNFLDETLDKIRRQYDRLREDFYEQDGQKRIEIRRRWMHQLQDDALWNTGENAEESRLWQTFRQSLTGDWGL